MDQDNSENNTSPVFKAEDEENHEENFPEEHEMNNYRNDSVSEHQEGQESNLLKKESNDVENIQDTSNNTSTMKEKRTIKFSNDRKSTRINNYILS